jgi:hypothetical protein
VISGLQRVSKPGLRVYRKYDEVPRVLGGLGVSVLSTSQGLMTDREARKRASVARSSATSGRSSACHESVRPPITIPAGVTCPSTAAAVTVKGPKGELSQPIPAPSRAPGR